MVLRESHVQKLTMQKTALRHFECSNVIFEKCDLSQSGVDWWQFPPSRVSSM